MIMLGLRLCRKSVVFVFKNLQEYIAAVLKRQKFELKIFGPSDYEKSRIFTASMLAEVYRKTDSPDAIFPAKAPFGEILRRGTALDPKVIYSPISISDKSMQILQGDIFEAQLTDFHEVSSPRFCMALSHSCDLANSKLVVVCPILTEEELNDVTMDKLFRSPAKNAQAIASRKQSLLNNENVKFVAFPPSDENFIPTVDSPIISAISMPTSIVLSQDIKPICRLSYRGLSYLQWRIASMYNRDVQESDDDRSY